MGRRPRDKIIRAESVSLTWGFGTWDLRGPWAKRKGEEQSGGQREKRRTNGQKKTKIQIKTETCRDRASGDTRMYCRAEGSCSRRS